MLSGGGFSPDSLRRGTTSFFFAITLSVFFGDADLAEDAEEPPFWPLPTGLPLAVPAPLVLAIVLETQWLCAVAAR